MANTYSQLNVHCVFAVKGRENLLSENFRGELFSYMSGILKNDGSYPLAVNGWKDHVHVFFELPVNMAVSKQMQMLKSASSKWINDKRLVRGKFRWQEGYGAFSYARSQRNTVIQYIKNQEAHHSKKSFREEYLKLLRDFAISYEEKYMFEFYD